VVSGPVGGAAGDTFCGFEPQMATTGVGSLPFRQPSEAVTFVLERGPDIPFWPQLPQRAFAEGMVAQYCRRIPCVRVNEEARSTELVLGSKYEELERFYADFLAEDPDRFGLSPAEAAGFHEFELAAAGRKWAYVKGQVTGPVTLSTSVTDGTGRAIFGDPELRDAAVKALARNAQWQVARLWEFASRGVLLFIDEPVLAAYGSSALAAVSEGAVHDMVGEVVAAIRGTGGIPGMHVCGNSDWGVMVGTGVDVLNFDSWAHGPTLSLYPEAVADLLERGGCIAWGAVPTTGAVGAEDVASLARRLADCMAALAQKGLPADLVRQRSLLTPACGTGSLSVDDTVRVFGDLADLARRAGDAAGRD
jgi:hypothetical protein